MAPPEPTRTTPETTADKMRLWLQDPCIKASMAMETTLPWWHHSIAKSALLWATLMVHRWASSVGRRSGTWQCSRYVRITTELQDLGDVADF